MKIKCSICGKDKVIAHYSKATLREKTNICYLCNRKILIANELKNIGQELRKDKVKRICLNCDKEFISKDKNRICNACKKLHKFQLEKESW